jgi:hypothetical protein
MLEGGAAHLSLPASAGGDATVIGLSREASRSHTSNEDGSFTSAPHAAWNRQASYRVILKSNRLIILKLRSFGLHDGLMQIVRTRYSGTRRRLRVPNGERFFA